MKKIIYVVFLLFISTSALCSASPVPNYSLGEISIDMNLGAPDLTNDSGKADGKYNVGYSVTAGVGFGFAGQYTYNNFKTKSPLNGSNEIKAQQLNVISNIFDTIANVSVFGGISQTEAVGGSQKDGLVVGIAANMPIAPKTKVYGVLSTGNHLGGYEIGISYHIAKDTDFNLGYHDTKYKDLTFEDDTKSDVISKGFIGGIHFKL